VLAVTLIGAIRAGEWLVAKGRRIPVKNLKKGSSR
jgi:hypothetical protein